MPASFRISIVGAGNLAWSLAKSLEDAGHEVREIFSQHIENSEELCTELYDAVPTEDRDFSRSTSEIFLVALNDDVLLAEIGSFSFPEESLVAHCSGAAPMGILSESAGQFGVFYPLQSFTKGQYSDFKGIPILLEANDYHGYESLESLAGSLSQQVLKVSSDSRKKIHLAAVFGSNFTNHLLSIARKQLEQEQLSLSVLKPLVLWTIQKAFDLGPERSQTGPALRKDFEVIDEHLKMLEGNTELVDLYENFTRQIMELGEEMRSRDLKNP